MSSKVPKWIGPALSPVVFIVLIAAVCFYYCYWKPRREKTKEKNQAVDEQAKKRVISPSLSRQSSVSKNKNKQPDDEEMSYGSGYYDCDMYTSYGPYCMDYCPLPSSGLNYCVLNEGRPKTVYCPKTTSCHSKSRDPCTTFATRSKNTNKIVRGCRVQCPRGECIKCPDLPMISEGNSTLSLCDEKEEEEQKLPLMDVGSPGENNKDPNQEDQNPRFRGGQDEDTISDYCGDSGFEDH